MKLTPPAKSDLELSCFPLPICQAIWNEVTAITQAPYELVIAGGLAAMSVACQGLIDVARPGCRPGPVSLAVLAIGDSGERKSTIDRMKLAVVRAYEQYCRERYDDEMREHKDQVALWQLRYSARVKEIKALIRQGEDVTQAEESLLEFRKTRPAPPSRVRFLYEDVTVPALLLGMLQHSPSAALVSSEGSSILSGPALRDMAKINALWSGDDVIVDRAASEGFMLTQRRLTLSAQLQPSAVVKFLEKRGEEARGSGFLARCLVFNPQSTQGTRFLDSGTVSREHSAPYENRMVELLKKSAMAGHIDGFEREVIRFSPEAASRWLEIYNYIEKQMQPGLQYANARDHASKLAENIARVAAILHYFEGFAGDISLDTLNAASKLCERSSQHFMQVFVPPRQDTVDAKMLDEWLTYRCRNYSQHSIQRNIILQFGPNSLREKNRLNQALMVLADQNRIGFEQIGKTMMINVCANNGLY